MKPKCNCIIWEAMPFGLVDVYYCFGGTYKYPLTHQNVTDHMSNDMSKKTVLFIVITVRTSHLTELNYISQKKLVIKSYYMT
jgi:hypothetical protein